MEDQAGWIWAISTKNNIREEHVTDITLVHSASGEVQIFEEKLGEVAPFKKEEITFFFASPNQALYFLTTKGFWKYLPNEGFLSIPLPNRVQVLNTFDDKTFYGSSADGLVQFDTTGLVLRNNPFSTNNNFKWLQGNKDGSWLRQLGSPLIYFPKDGGEAITAQMDFNNGERKPYHFDPIRNWVWVADYENLKAFDEKGAKVYDLKRDNRELFPNHIGSLFIDQKGLVWIGTRFGIYLLEVKKNKFTRYLYSKPDDLAITEMVRCRGVIEKNGILFVNTYQGSKKIDLKNGQVKELDRPRPFPNASIYYSFCKSPEGTIWTGSNHLSKMDGSTGGLLESFEVPGDGYKQWALFADKEGKVWLNKGEGIYTLKEGKLSTFQAYNGFSSLENSQIYFYHEDKEGQIWLGTDSGLYELDLQQGISNHFWHGGTNGFYLPGTQIQHIHEDEDGFFWMATENEGLIKWHPKTHDIQHITRANGLPTNTIYSVYEDERGYLWMSSDSGIIQMDKNTFSKKTFLPEDGTTFHEFNRISHFQAADGRIYFGSQNGVTAFYPKDFWESFKGKNESVLQLYEFKKGDHFGTRIVSGWGSIEQEKGQILLNHDTRLLDFKFSCSDYFRSDKIKFYYRLESKFNNPNTTLPIDWMPCNDNEVRIPGINPGKYQLIIEARALDGEQVGQSIVYQIIMRPPFTHTVWFRVMLTLLLVGSAYGFYRWRVTRLKQQKILLEQMVEERTQQILQDQVIIEKQAQKIQELDSLLNEADTVWMNELDEVVKEKLSNFNLNIAEIADEMNISRTHFFRKIKTVTGLTPNQYLQEARLLEAKSLLDEGKYTTVKAVSLSVGFKNSSYFSRLFKERFGVSPTDFFAEN